MHTLPCVEFRLRFDRKLSPGEATHLRGHFGHEFSEEVLLHHHERDGRLRYDYPRVQFKVLEHMAHLLGLADGCDLVQQLWKEVDTARLGDEELPVLESQLIRRHAPLGECAKPIQYRFLTPWLGLNQHNYKEYQALTNPGEQQQMLERVLVGNCLSLAKAFEHRVGTHLEADAHMLRPWPLRFKGLAMLAFVGTFRINFELPTHIGLGKSVSRGFGTVEPMS